MSVNKFIVIGITKGIVKSLVLKYNTIYRIFTMLRRLSMIWYDLPIKAGVCILTVYVVYAVFARIRFRRAVLCSAFIIYLTAVVTLTLFPMPVKYYALYTLGAEREVYLKPFTTILYQLEHFNYWYLARQLLGNILLGIPFGYLAPQVFRMRSKLRIYFSFVLFPVLIELSQYVAGELIGFRYRTTDIDDVILNLIGALIGYFIYRRIRRMVQRVRRSTSLTRTFTKYMGM